MDPMLYKLMLGAAGLILFSLGFYLGYMSGYGVGKLHRQKERS